MAFQRMVRAMRKGNLGIGVLTLVLLAAGLFLLWHGKPGEVIAQGQGPGMETPPAQGAGNARGLGFLAAGLSVGLAALGAGLAVSMVGSAAMGALVERPELTGRSMIYVGLAEGIAIYGLVISIMILGKL